MTEPPDVSHIRVDSQSLDVARRQMKALSVISKVIPAGSSFNIELKLIDMLTGEQVHNLNWKVSF